MSWFGLGSDLRWARSGPARADLGPGQQQGGCALDFRVLVLNSSKLFLASDLGFTGIPESGFRGPGLRCLDLGFWVSGGLGPCFAPEAPVVRPRASRPEADYPEGRLACERILARERTFNNKCAI